MERREPKRGVNIRHDDDEELLPRRVRWGQLMQAKDFCVNSEPLIDTTVTSYGKE